jgi:protein SCO1/2
MKRGLLAAVAALAVLFVVGLGVLGFQRFATASNDAPPRIGGPFTLADGSGKPVTDQDFRGRFMLIYFGYTHCPDACPTALNNMALALDKLGAARNRVAPIFITVDPERDTGQVLVDYVAAFAPDFVGLTGTPEQLGEAKRVFKVYAAKHPTKDGDYDMDHSSAIYLMDPSGRFIGNFTQESSPEEIAAKLGSLMS